MLTETPPIGTGRRKEKYHADKWQLLLHLIRPKELICIAIGPSRLSHATTSSWNYFITTSFDRLSCQSTIWFRTGGGTSIVIRELNRRLELSCIRVDENYYAIESDFVSSLFGLRSVALRSVPGVFWGVFGKITDSKWLTRRVGGGFGVVVSSPSPSIVHQTFSQTVTVTPAFWNGAKQLWFVALLVSIG